jgi:hypothetical protein
MTALAGGADEFWVVDPGKHSVTVYSGRTGISVYGRGETVPVSLFGGSISLDDLFRDID